MAKAFLEVFPDLSMTPEMDQLFRLVHVERVSATRDRSSLSVYINSPRLIDKRTIHALEKGIREQLFPGKKITIKIMEKYSLSGQYNPEKLLSAYKDSLLYELKNYSIVEYNIFRRAKCSFPQENLLRMTVEDNAVFREKTGELRRILEKIFYERCGLPIDVEYEFVEAPKNSLLKQREAQVRREIEEKILNHPMFGGGAAGQRTYEEGEAAEQKHFGNAASAGKGPKDRPPSGVKKPGAAPADGPVLPQTGRDSFSKENRRFGSYQRKSDNPDVLYGRDFEDEFSQIRDIGGEMGEVTIRGKIIAKDSRLLKSGKTIVIFDVTDFTDTITVKLFVREDALEDIDKAVTKGQFIKLKGMTTIDKFDGELTIGSVVGLKKCEDFSDQRTDNSLVKRVELHCHTKMSDMDGVSDVKDLVNRAKKWGMPALAITDHGCVQAFPDASHALDKEDAFKVIYGVEGYLVDDEKQLVENGKGQDLDDPYVVFDIETTGFSPLTNHIIEIGAVRVEKGKIVDRFSTFVNPDEPIPFRIEQLTKINDSMVLDAPRIHQVLPEFLTFCQGAALVAHNASFDVSFIDRNARLLGLAFDPTVLDTVALARMLLPQISRYKLDTVAKVLNISLENHHRAVEDAETTAEIFVAFRKMLKERGIQTLKELNRLGDLDKDKIKKLPSYHIIILAKNDLGRTNLYRLVSKSHIEYYHKRPRIPKSLLRKHREGLIIGSACEAGELYQAVLRGIPDTEVGKIVEFYDYLEIQPLGNNDFMLRDEDSSIKSEDDLKDINRRIVHLGEEFCKPVCATCDVHFLDPEDEIYRRIIMSHRKFKDSDDQAPLYLRTTQEMLDEFSYLGPDKAEEVVVTNTRRIADQCERISPVRPDKCPPVIASSDETLRNICYNRAHELYGDDLPEIVVERLERELNSIISNGFAVMYIIAQKLVWKSNEDGYLVGSRGSVGSSLVATMSGITEVNPLSPHYYCPKCHFSDFDSPEVKKFGGMSGCDMPDRECPKCGTMMNKDGHDIPFETFLGFKGDKEPDIDLNFSGEYQSHAHDYTEVIFGKGQTFRAGTIGTLADKTAYGYVKNYYEERGDRKRGCEINRIVQGCVGVRRTTGQHPGGIVVLPVGEEIYSFTPVQRPANDMETTTITTHFDYHSIDHNLLKLDILGHDDPTMIKMLEEYITSESLENDYNEEHPFVATQIPLDDQEVLSLFHGTQALGIKPEDIEGCKLGCLGIPEFGTDFAMSMVIEANPQSLSDLIRLAGLSHGTDVWLGNAQDLIRSGTATISTAICTRDDIMIYLINQGVDSALSFTIMESVRKGKGLKDEWIAAMKEKNVPDWYIGSCKKIKYMFPKAHAAAYVMMAYRIAYCKINYPLAYYGAYFSIRADAFSYELMCQGKEKLNYYIKDYKKRSDTLTNKEQDTLKDMRLVQEMYARGLDFTPIDLYRAKAKQFQIVDGKLMPSFASIEGMGEKAAEAVELAAKDGAFLSLDDFRERTKVSVTVIDLMSDLGLFGDLPQSNQLSLFDLA